MKKKSLLLAIAAMSMAAVGVGTVGTFAWYQAAHYGQATIHTAGTSGITTANQAEVESMEVNIPVTITAATAVELTATGTVDGETEGYTYVINNGTRVPANNQTELVKNGIGTFAVKENPTYLEANKVTKVVNASNVSLTEEDVTAFNQNKMYTVKIAASSKVRVGVDVENKTNSERTENSWVDGDYTAGTDVLLGTATITLAWDSTANEAYVSEVAYSADSGNVAGAITADAGLYFYYSVSPTQTGNSTESGDYGVISAKLA